MTNTMTLFEKVATIGTINTEAMRTAIYGLEEISELHKYALCSCLNSVEFRVKNGESVDAILQYGYQDIMPGLQPTPEALTNAQKILVYNTIADEVKAALLALAADVENTKMAVIE